MRKMPEKIITGKCKRLKIPARECKRSKILYTCQGDSHVPCDILTYWSAFPYALFSILNHILNRILQYGRIYLTYLFPYGSSLTEELKRRCALDSIPFSSPRICFDIHAGKNCRVLEFLCVIHKIRFHRFAIGAGQTIKHYKNWLFRAFYHFSPCRIFNLNHIASIQSITPKVIE